MPLIDAATGKITRSQIPVATFGASNYTYDCATAQQTTADWLRGCKRKKNTARHTSLWPRTDVPP
jgi:hypothetical protein